MEHFPTFMEIELPASYMNEFFPIMERIPINITIDPSQSFMACVLHETTDVTIEAIMRLEDYMTMQTVKVV